ncbi:ASCH domain-containing protein [uncultured Campylobacter sp.]|uniref:ASCH domain-containing protein n=1 Tax=uncultured Campylobacter sp. TaxID=218934 RepID=UPI00260DAF5F|nr:ASCH domain-containing protein [uncultured Campylobacter sp.]
MTALLSIKPEFAEAIFNGTKRFEFRKVNFKKKVNKIKVYATKPIGKIIGEFIIDDILEDTPEKLWDKTQTYAGIDKNRYLRYFTGRDVGFAIKIKSTKRYQRPICPYSEYPNFVAPQSFMYI